MDLTPYLDTLRGDLLMAAAPGGAEISRAAELLGGSLEASARLALLEALSDATAEITAQLSAASVEVRLRGRDAELVVTEYTETAPEPSGPPAVDLEGDLTRITLRVPETLKERVEAAASQDGVSVNAWLARAVATAVTRYPAAAPRRDHNSKDSKRITGWAQA
jgi:predicted HicB family RNase H-like nuclease